MLPTGCVLFFLVHITSANLMPKVQLKSFEDHGLVPDVISMAPSALLTVSFPSGVKAGEGGVLPLDKIVEQPTLVWEADPNHFYTVIFVDPDVSSRADPMYRSFVHWLVVNVPGDDVTAGTTLASFIHSQPRPGTGLHRYVFFVYEQPGKLVFDRLPDFGDLIKRAWFSLEDFSHKFNLGAPIAGNFYQSQNLTKV